MKTLRFGEYKFALTGKVIAAVIGITVLIVGLLLYTQLNGIYNKGNQLEQRLQAQYLDNQNYLSAYISGFYEQVDVAQTGSEALNQVLLDAVKGRYENSSGGGGYTVESPFFNAIVEAYPEAGPTEMVRLWNNIQGYVVQGREGYRNQQSKLLDVLRTYETWRTSGLVQRQVVGLMGFPSDRLIARIGTNTWRGQDALDKMFIIVLTQDAADAYDDGTLDPLEIPDNE